MKKLLLSFAVVISVSVSFIYANVSADVIPQKAKAKLERITPIVPAHFHTCDHSYCMDHPYDGYGSNTYMCPDCSTCRGL